MTEITKLPGDGTNIEWLLAIARSRGMRAAVWNWAEGCSPAGEGCRNCWAAREVQMRGMQSGGAGDRYTGLTERQSGRPVFNGAVRVIEHDLVKPLRTRRPTVYFCSRFDPFHPQIDTETLDRAFAVMALRPRHLFVMLTKRPELMRKYIEDVFADDLLGFEPMTKAVNAVLSASGRTWDDCGSTGTHITTIGWDEWGYKELPLPNLWLGVSVWDQDSATDSIAELVKTAAAKRLVSAEPLLGPIDLRRVPRPTFPARIDRNGNGYWEVPKLDMVIAGAENAPIGRRRVISDDDFRTLRDQCQSADIPFFFKQAYRDGRLVSMPELDGMRWGQVPE